MGPRARARGNRLSGIRIVFVRRRLQWGGERAIAERRQVPGARAQRPRHEWGRERPRAETRVHSEDRAGGRRCNGRGSARARKHHYPWGPAGLPERLQWGRERALAETRITPPGSGRGRLLQWGRERALAETS